MSPAIHLTLVNVPYQRWSGVVLPQRQTIGRGPECPIRLPKQFPGVSRCHAAVWCDAKGLWLVDLSSSLGTQINGIALRAEDEYQFLPGDRLWLGGAELTALHLSVDAKANPSLLQPTEGDADSTQQLRSRTIAPSQESFAALTRAELDVMLWISRGYVSFDEIGKKLFRSPHTVRTQLGSIFEKLNVHSREDLLALVRDQS